MNSKYVIPAAVCLALAIVFAGHSYKNSVMSAHVDPTAYGQESAVGPIRNVRFTVFVEGIRPNEIRIKAGLVNISFEDKSNMAQGVTVRRRTGTNLIDVGVVQKAPDQARGRNLFRLTPGEYELFDSSQLAQKAVILVEP